MKNLLAAALALTALHAIADDAALIAETKKDRAGDSAQAAANGAGGNDGQL